MGYRLRDGVSFCDAGDRLLFLDIWQDRYFCLSEAADAMFRRLTTGERLVAEDQAHRDALRASGLLVGLVGASRPTACDWPVPTASAFDRSDMAAGTIGIVRALASLATARAALRLRGLGPALRHVGRRKKRAALDAGGGPGLAPLPAAFRAAGLIAAPLDQCLPRSIALAHRCIDVRARPDIVVAVRLQPFAAHCWVEHDGAVLNDRADVVRLFTPILVI